MAEVIQAVDFLSRSRDSLRLGAICFSLNAYSRALRNSVSRALR